LSNLQWHARQALAILNIAEGEQLKKTYVSSYIALRSFEEIIDAYSAREGLHFHDKFTVTAWEERMVWMRIHRKDLLCDWKLLVELYSLISTGRDSNNKCSISKMMKIVTRHLKMLIEDYDL